MPEPTTDQPVDALQPWVIEWVEPFLDFVARERRLSDYTVRNYRQAVEEFGRWLADEKGGAASPAVVDARLIRDYMIEAQRRISRRTLHNRLSALRSFYRFWDTELYTGEHPSKPG